MDKVIYHNNQVAIPAVVAITEITLRERGEKEMLKI